MNGQELRALRERLELTQAESAPMLGITMDAVSMMERGKINMKRSVEMLALQLDSTLAQVALHK